MKKKIIALSTSLVLLLASVPVQAASSWSGYTKGRGGAANIHFGIEFCGQNGSTSVALYLNR